MIENGRYYSDEYLCHYGIPGMKWGVRRYQNSDGSLTPAGRKRYGIKGAGGRVDVSMMTSKGRKRYEHDQELLKSKPKIIKISELSDEELNKKLSRLRQENEYRRLMKERTTSTKSYQLWKDIGRKAIVGAGSALLTAGLVYAGQQGFRKMAGDDAYSKVFNKPINKQDNTK